MAVIKAQVAPVGAKPFSMADIETAAKRVLLRARQQADALLAEAQVQAEELCRQAVEEARAQGYEAGHQEGLAAGQAAGQAQALAESREQLAQVISALTAAASEIEQSRRELENQALTEVIELAIAIARRITRRQGELDPRVLAENLQDAMKLVVHRADLRVAIHPRQRQVMESLLPELQLRWPALEHVTLVEDANLVPGGCRVHCHDGMVDADLDGQLDRVIADLLPAPAKAGGEGT